MKIKELKAPVCWDGAPLKYLVEYLRMDLEANS